MTPAEWIALITVLAPFAVKLLQLLNAKVKNEKASAVMSAAEQAALFVEEVAAENPELIKTGSDKLTEATRELLRKHPNLNTPEAKQLIKTVLPKLGLGAAGKKLRADIGGALNGQ